MYRAEEPVPNLQHQPVILQAGVAPAAPPAPKLDAEMEYRSTVAETGVRANDAGFNKMVSAGMTDTPKSRWGVNSVLNDVVADEKADKAKNDKVVADPNAGAPAGDKAVTPEKLKKAIEKAAADAPNPNAKPEDPATDPAAVAAAANKMDDAASVKAEAKDAAKKAAPKAAFEVPETDPNFKASLAQIKDINGDPTKIDSVKGPS